ncbi:hypothetical protein [Streptomyces hirsutus]|uniref:hypothetical protein n=1 Tax=Streptomyces hirsutus TaxID=35620 RepID=UPI0036C2F7C5
MSAPVDYVLQLAVHGEHLTRTLTVDTTDTTILAQEVHRHARGILGADRVTIHLDETGLAGTVTSHGTHAGTFALQPDTPKPDQHTPNKADGIRYGWTLPDLDRLARAVVSNNRTWWPAGDRDDLYAAAWHGIVEHLYTAEQAPGRTDLMEAGRRALAEDVKATMRHHGARRDTSNNGQKYAMYWEWAGRSVPSPESPIVERLALTQILAALTPRQREAFAALAAAGDYADAARHLAIGDQTFRSLLGRARGTFRELWHEGETPSAHWGCDRRAGTVRGTARKGESAVYNLRRRKRNQAKREAAA